MKVIFILVDALRTEYITKRNTPFLYSLIDKCYYVNKVVPSPGFCERCEIFSGLDAYESGNFTAIGYDPANSSYRGEKLAINIIKILSKTNKNGAKYLMRKYREIKKLEMKPYRIPFDSLNKYRLTEDGIGSGIKYKTIFDVLNKEGKTYSLDAFTSLSDMYQKKITSYYYYTAGEINKNIDFIPLYFGGIDYYGHLIGLDEKEMRKHLISADQTLRDIYMLAKEEKYCFCVLGDHGMIPVEKNVNLLKDLESLNIDKAKYEVFLDSTMARFWFFDKKIKTIIQKMINEKYYSDGIFVDMSSCKKHGIPMNIKNDSGSFLYGDLIWYANPGVLITPDYFNNDKRPDKGMHGYLESDTPYGRGTFFLDDFSGEGKYVDKIRLKDVCKIICDALEIPYPN